MMSVYCTPPAARHALELDQVVVGAVRRQQRAGVLEVLALGVALQRLRHGLLVPDTLTSPSPPPLPSTLGPAPRGVAARHREYRGPQSQTDLLAPVSNLYGRARSC